MILFKKREKNVNAETGNEDTDEDVSETEVYEGGKYYG